MTPLWKRWRITSWPAGVAAMEAGCSAGERLVQFALNHFDRHPLPARPFKSLMATGDDPLAPGRRERPCSTRGQGLSDPMMVRVRQAIAEGSSSGELIPVDELANHVCGARRANAFYFLSAR